MAKSLPKAKPSASPIDRATYFVARRMESVGMLRPGQALMLAATLPNKQPKKGKRK